MSWESCHEVLVLVEEVRKINKDVEIEKKDIQVIIYITNDGKDLWVQKIID